MTRKINSLSFADLYFFSYTIFLISQESKVIIIKTSEAVTLKGIPGNVYLPIGIKTATRYRPHSGLANIIMVEKIPMNVTRANKYE
jgi:hypothetical protein